MSPYAYLPMLTHLVCHHTLTYQSSIFDSTQAYPEYLVTFISPEPLDLEDSAVETVLFELSAPAAIEGDAGALSSTPPALSEEQMQAWIDVYVQFASNCVAPTPARVRFRSSTDRLPVVRMCRCNATG